MERPKTPGYNVPTWALATDYPAGASTWSGTPTKAVPPIAGYFAPDDAALAQYFNYLYNEELTVAAQSKAKITQLVNYIGQLQALNWRRTATQANGAVDDSYAYCESEGLWFGSDGSNIRVSYDGGDSWGTVIGNTSGGPWDLCASTGPQATAGTVVCASTGSSTVFAPVATGGPSSYTGYSSPITVASPWSGYAGGALRPASMQYSQRDDTFYCVAVRDGMAQQEYGIFALPAPFTTWAQLGSTIQSGSSGTYMYAHTGGNAANRLHIQMSPGGDLWVFTLDIVGGALQLTRCSNIGGSPAIITQTATMSALGIGAVATTDQAMHLAAGPVVAERLSSISDTADEQESDYKKGMLLALSCNPSLGNIRCSIMQFDTSSSFASFPAHTLLRESVHARGHGPDVITSIAQRGDLIVATTANVRNVFTNNYVGSFRCVYTTTPAGAWYASASSAGVPCGAMTVYDGGFQVYSNKGPYDSVALYKTQNTGYGAGFTTPALGNKLV